MATQALRLAVAAKTDDAVNAFTYYIENVLPEFQEASDALDALNLHIINAAAQANALNRANATLVLIIIASIIGVSIVALLAVGQYFSTNILAAVERVIDVASAIAEGDFSKEMDPALLARKDEFGTMARALNAMQSNLVATIEQLNSNAEKLAASNELAQKANESKSFFLARMSHEIRTPLNAITGMTHIAKKADDPVKIHDSLNKIATSSAHLLGIINDILDMTKIEAGKFELVQEEFSLEKLLMNVCKIISGKANEKEQHVQVTVKNGLPSQFIGDKLRLSQLLINMLNNASKFTPQGGSISLTASCLRQDPLTSKVQFIVADTGIGLTEEQIGRLFTPFEQADGGTARQFGGTGLGLAICNTIATLMDGDIRVESEFGKGSRFIVTVTLHNSQQRVPARLAPGIDARRIHVLLVAPSRDTRDFFTGIFNELNMRVAALENFDDALEYVKKNAGSAPLTMLFADWAAIEPQGVSCLKKARDAAGELVIAVLAPPSTVPEVEDLVREAGVSKVLPKPVFPSALINAVNEAAGAPEEGSVQDSAAAVDLRGKKILLVEDVAINREIVLAYSENTGVHIDVAENGLEAMEKHLAANGGYDLILMDINMPVMDGYAATRGIREQEKTQGWKRTLIIAMTANAFAEDKENCLAAGMDNHLAKPLDSAAFMKNLGDYLA